MPRSLQFPYLPIIMPSKSHDCHMQPLPPALVTLSEGVPQQEMLSAIWGSIMAARAEDANNSTGWVKRAQRGLPKT
ncbi:hypothetical protein NQZ68_039875 [Dissostichus eleginoides]|nr:hypothetical protein NQZ68_039875 [Dissostichus eleginoides]